MRALERAGASVTLTADRATAQDADGLSCPAWARSPRAWQGLRAVRGHEVIGRRLAGGRPVLGICVGMQILFERGVEHGVETEGCDEWPGVVERLQAPVVPHMGWNTVEVARGDRAVRGRRGRAVLLRALVRRARLDAGHQRPDPGAAGAPGPSTAATGSSRPWRTARCRATQFHPEKSGDAGAALLRNWVAVAVSSPEPG